MRDYFTETPARGHGRGLSWSCRRPSSGAAWFSCAESGSVQAHMLYTTPARLNTHGSLGPQGQHGQAWHCAHNRCSVITG